MIIITGDKNVTFSEESIKTSIAAYKLGKPTYTEYLLEGMRNIHISKFFNYEKLDANNYAIFNTLLMDVLVVNENEFENIKNMSVIDDLDKDLLIKKGIYVIDEAVDDKALSVLREDFMYSTCQIGVLYLILTTSCNLACKYCFVNNYSEKKIEEIVMSSSVAMKALESFEKHLKDTNNTQGKVVLYGGEPTLNWNVLEQIVLRARDKDYKIILVTNGTLLNEEKITFLMNNKVEVGVSIDGPDFINDENRVYLKDGKGSYDRVLKTINLFEELGASYNLSITISKTILKHKNTVIEWLKNIKVANVFFNLLHFSEYDMEWEAYQNEASLFLTDAYEKLNLLGIQDGRIARKLENYLNNSFRFIDCAACGANQISVKPNGSLCVCQCCAKSNDYELGTIFNESFDDIVSTPEMLFWKNSLTILKEECLRCKALFICGGGCPMQSQALFNSRYEIDRTACIHSKITLSWILKQNFLFEKEI